MRPFFFSFATPLLLLGGSFGADLLDSMVSHLREPFLLYQLVEEGVDGVHNVSVNVTALAGAFNERGRHSGVFRQQRRVAIGFAVDQFLKGRHQFVLSRLRCD